MDTLRRTHEDRKKDLIMKKNHLSLRDSLKVQVTQLSNQYDIRRDELQKNDVHHPLQQHEQKIRQMRQTLFSLEDWIKEKSAETNYIPTKGDCMRMCDNINDYLRDPKRLEKTYS